MNISPLNKLYPNNNGFTDKAEAENLLVNGVKEGKWIEYTKDFEWKAVDGPTFYY